MVRVSSSWQILLVPRFKAIAAVIAVVVVAVSLPVASSRRKKIENPSLKIIYLCIHTYIHTYIIHTYIHTYIHTNKQTCLLFKVVCLFAQNT